MYYLNRRYVFRLADWLLSYGFAADCDEPLQVAGSFQQGTGVPLMGSKHSTHSKEDSTTSFVRVCATPFYFCKVASGPSGSGLLYLAYAYTPAYALSAFNLTTTTPKSRAHIARPGTLLACAAAPTVFWGFLGGGCGLVD